MTITLLQGDYRAHLGSTGLHDCAFADPPDNINKNYDGYDDRLPVPKYREWLRSMIRDFTSVAPIVWLSFNSRWSSAVGRFVDEFLEGQPDWCYQDCVQVFTFGQHNNHGLGNNHRPLWLLHHKDAPFYPDAIRIQSWRQRHGDKRADSRGRVPGDVFDMQYPDCGDVFDFPRVTGNSKQRCDWHPTQLHLDLVERCIAYSTLPGDSVFDPFAGTGTTARVCQKLCRDCLTVELDRGYCAAIADALGLREQNGLWSNRNA